MRKPTNVPKEEYFIYVANKPRKKTIELIGQRSINRLRKVLDEITEQGRLPESPEFDDFKRGSCRIVSQKTIFLEDEERLNHEEFEEPYLTGLLTSDGKNFARFELSRSLILFLRKKGNLKKIKKCKQCKYFFIAKNVKRAICYKERCRNFYQADLMRKRRENTKNKCNIKTT